MLTPREQLAQHLGIAPERVEVRPHLIAAPEYDPELFAGAPGGLDERPNHWEGRSYKEVNDGPELRRIGQLPRRPPPADTPEAGQLAEFLTHRLARHPDPYPCGRQYQPGNTGYMRPIQAVALSELWQYGGILGPIRAGAGKTLIAVLAATVVRAVRPLYVCPANLIESVDREFAKLAQHWHTPRPDTTRGYWRPGTIKIVSYSRLSHENAGVKHDTQGNVLRRALLDKLAPDLIVFDEAHAVSNLKAAVTRRVRRFLESNTQVRVIAMSGTLTRSSIKDFAHLARWTMPRMCPVPQAHGELDQWADALDVKQGDQGNAEPGALIQLASNEEARIIAAASPSRVLGHYTEVEQTATAEQATAAARQAVRRRIVDTPGCVATQDGPLGIPLTIDALQPAAEDPRISEFFQPVRALWQLPNGRPIADGLEMARHAATMGLGFWTSWDPAPPQEWLTARSEWAEFCRETIKNNRRGLDSEKPVKDAVKAGLYNDHGALDSWEGVKHLYDPEEHKVAVWFSDESIQAVGAWVEQHPAGIVWVKHIEMGTRLSQVLKIPYYGEGGRDAKKNFIEDHKHGTPLIASAAANRTGRNLQFGWSEGLLCTAPDEQLLARVHRPGQLAEFVRFWQYLGCREHCASYWRAVERAQYQQDQFGQAMRLVYAETRVPLQVSGVGDRWA